jgi:hypothetical protein
MAINKANESNRPDRHLPDTTRPDCSLPEDKGETHWSQASGDGLQKPVPKQFNELDESASSQVSASASIDEVGKQAYLDTLNSVDTDRGPVMDAVYNGPVTEGNRTGNAQRREEKMTEKAEKKADRRPGG